MPTNKEIQKIKQKAREGQSVNQIKEELGLPKSTVYYHFKKEVGQKQKENALEIPEDEEFKGEICGIFAGDGYIYVRGDGHYEITVTLNYKDDYWEELLDLFNDKLDKKPQVIEEEEHGRIRVRYSSVKLYNLFNNYLSWSDDKTATVRLKSHKVSKKFKRGFVRGLLDTDGSKDKKYQHYKYGSISQQLAKDFCKILSEFEIETSLNCREDKRENCRDIYRVRVYGDDAEKLGRKIEPRHPKKKFKSS